MFQGMSTRFAPQGTMPSVTPTEQQRKLSYHGNEFIPGSKQELVDINVGRLGNESNRQFAAPFIKEIVTP